MFYTFQYVSLSPKTKLIPKYFILNYLKYLIPKVFFFL